MKEPFTSPLFCRRSVSTVFEPVACPDGVYFVFDINFGCGIIASNFALCFSERLQFRCPRRDALLLLPVVANRAISVFLEDWSVGGTLRRGSFVRKFVTFVPQVSRNKHAGEVFLNSCPTAPERSERREQSFTAKSTLLSPVSIVRPPKISAIACSFSKVQFFDPAEMNGCVGREIIKKNFLSIAHAWSSTSTLWFRWYVCTSANLQNNFRLYSRRTLADCKTEHALYQPYITPTQVIRYSLTHTHTHTRWFLHAVHHAARVARLKVSESLLM